MWAFFVWQLNNIFQLVSPAEIQQSQICQPVGAGYAYADFAVFFAHNNKVPTLASRVLNLRPAQRSVMELWAGSNAIGRSNLLIINIVGR